MNESNKGSLEEDDSNAIDDLVEQEIRKEEINFMNEISTPSLGKKTKCIEHKFEPFMKLHKDDKTHLDQLVVETTRKVEIDSTPPRTEIKHDLHYFILKKIYDHQNKALRL